MSTALIPESAPFSTEQRAWLNGFFAGLTKMPDATDSNGNGSSNMQSIVDSVAGNAMGEAGAREAAAAEPEEEFPWHDESLPMQERLDLAEGKPVSRKLMAAMAQLDCGACGYVCKTYSEAIASGEEKSLKLCSPGGADTAKAFKRILKETPSETSTSATETNGKRTPVDTPTTGYDRNKPFEARLAAVRNLNGPGSAKHTSHVELDLNGSGLTYDVGDALGVYPINCTELTAEVLRELDDAADQQVTFAGETLSLAYALDHRCDLAEVTDELLKLLLRHAADDAERTTLEKWLEDGAPEQFDVLEVLQQHRGGKPPAAEIVGCLAPMQARLYSISSSLQAHPSQVHLTVGRVAWQQGTRVRKGVASTMFSDRLRPDSKVRVFVQKSHGFRLPADPSKPIIMVGPGTGVAPFRAFLHERALQENAGKSWLFFGDQKQSCDFLYREELEQMLSSGKLTRMDTAFSRDQEEKVYVQDRMRQHAAQLWQWLSEGAHFYVCGDAKRMAADVDRALREIVAEYASHGDTFYEALKADGRYQRDVY